MPSNAVSEVLSGTATRPEFFVSFRGDLQGAQFADIPSLYARYTIISGIDWDLVAGEHAALTQVSRRSSDSSISTLDFVWNAPLDLTFRTTNIYGWPRIAIAFYGLDIVGREVLRGYSVCALPLVDGTSTIETPIFAPRFGSLLDGAIGSLIGQRPEFKNLEFLVSKAGRECTRVRTMGEAVLEIEVQTLGAGN